MDDYDGGDGDDGDDDGGDADDYNHYNVDFDAAAVAAAAAAAAYDNVGDDYYRANTFLHFPHLTRPPPERKIPGSNPVCAGMFSGSSHISDLKIGTSVATLPGTWRYRVSTGTGRLGVSIL